MTRFPNQKHLIIDKPENMVVFAQYPIEDIRVASMSLTPSAFRVWLYLLSNKAQLDWDVYPSNAEKEWGISSSSWSDGKKQLELKGFLEKGVIHSKSTKPLSEIRKKKRKSETRKDSLEIREDTYETRENNSEIHSRNNINNITNNNIKNNIKSFPNTSVVKAQRPKDESIKPSQSEDEFIF